MLYLAIESLAKTLNTSVAKYTNKKISFKMNIREDTNEQEAERN